MITKLQQKARRLDTELAYRHDVEETLEERNRMLDALVTALPLPIAVIDADTTVRLWSRAAERFFGWSAEEVVGRRMPIVPDEKLGECANLRRAILEGQRVVDLETYCLRRDGSHVPVAIWAALLNHCENGEPAILLLFQDMSERLRADNTRAQLAAIVESSQDAIVGKSLEGIVSSWNHSAEVLFGYTAEEMIGQPISRLVPPDRPNDVAHILSAIRRGERVEHYETERVRKDGRRIQVSLTVSPIKDSTGRIIGASKIARDVTQRKQMDAERENLLRIAEQLRAASEAANRAKDKFLAMLGHELRNPLSTARNSVMTARCDPLHRDRALDLAHRSIDQLGRLVDDLLDVARITQGRITLRREMVPFAQLVTRAVESARPLIDQRAHAVILSLAGSDLQVDGDPMRLQQVVANLLFNAAKYMDVGGQIRVTVAPEGPDAVLRVRDAGIGIAPDMLPRIFEPFFQADQALDRAQGGLGIGLTLVKHLVELHGGCVEAHSEGIGKGAEFIIRLPATRVLHGTTSANERSVLHTGGCVRVLVVEDSAIEAESMIMLLELLGHMASAVGDGPSALAAARANRPDVMLVDIGLPVMDGYEVARHVRQDEALREITLIALTGYDQDEDRQHALAAGFDHHMVKPIDVDKFQRLMRQLAAKGTGTF